MSEPYGTPQHPYGTPGQPPAHGQTPPPPPAHGQTPPGPPAYGPPAYGAPYGAPPGYGHPSSVRRQNDDTVWAMMNYIGTIVLGVLAPLIIYFVKRRESPFVRFHAAQCLNFVITGFVYLVSAMALLAAIAIPSVNTDWTPGLVIGLGLFGLAVLGAIVYQTVFLILAIVRAARYEWYRIPTWACWRMIR